LEIRPKLVSSNQLIGWHFFAAQFNVCQKTKIMPLRKASLAALSRNVANGGITKLAMKHSRTFCSISLCFITTKDCTHTWITKAQANMKQKQQKSIKAA